MSVMDDSRVSLERQWNDWVVALLPWERHYVFGQIPDGVGSRELDWHDDFVAGNVTLDILTEILVKQFAASK